MGILNESSDNAFNIFPSGRCVAPPVETMIADFASGHGFAFQTPGVGAQADETTIVYSGAQSLCLTTDGAHGVSFTRKSGLTMDFTGQCLKIMVYVDHPERLEELWVMSSSDAWSNFITWKPSADLTQLNKTPATWVPLTLPWGAGTLTSSPVRNAMVALQLRVRDKGTGAVKVYFDFTAKTPEAAAAKGVITIDDGYSTLYTAALPILSAVGIPAQVSVIPELVGTTGYCTWAQLRECQDVHRWGMAQHTALDLTTVSIGRAEAILREGKMRMLDEGLNSCTDHLVYANGGYNAAVLALVREYYRSARTIANYSETLPPADWHRIRVKQVLNTATIDTTALGAVITAAATNKLLFVPVYHKFETPDSTTMQRSIASFTTDVANFAASGIQWSTMSGVYQ